MPEFTPPGKPLVRYLSGQCWALEYSSLSLFVCVCVCVCVYVCVCVCPLPINNMLNIIAGESIAVEYLLAQSNRGDQLIAHHNNMPEVPPEDPEDDETDTTVCHAADLRADDSDPPVAEAQVTGQVGDTGPKSPDEEVTEEEEDDTASPSTSGQVMLLSCTIF